MMADKDANSIDALVIELRNQKVILDSDVATIYGVQTRAVNQAVQRNSDKFPDGYILELDKNEWDSLKSHFVISKTSAANQSVESQNATPKGGKVKPPKAFTEKGLYMLATILKSQRATTATLQIIETFAKFREFSKVAKSLATEQDKATQQQLTRRSGELIGDILNQSFVGETSHETTIELNLAMIKVKHTIKRKGQK